MIEVTEADVLRGELSLLVERRDGSEVQVQCQALSWPVNCKVMNLQDPAEMMVHTLLGGLPKELGNDAFLNALTPQALSEISTTILRLTNGISALKKAQAARNQSAPTMPISSPPPANSATTDSAGRKSQG